MKKDDVRMIELDGEKYLDGDEASNLLGVKMSTLYTYVSRGILKSYKQGIKRQRLYKQAELKEILSKTIQGLPPSFRMVFVLRDVEGLSTEETADALGLSVPAVKSRLLRARLQLRERLTKYFRKQRNGDTKQ